MVLYKCKKELIEKRKVYSTITQKTEELFLLRQNVKAISKDFTKYADVSISNTQNTFLASLLDLRAKIFINNENQYINGERHYLLSGINNLLKSTFFNCNGDRYFDINRLYSLSTRKQLGGSCNELLNTNVYLMKNLKFNQNFDSSLMKNNNLLYLLGLGNHLTSSKGQGYESYQDILCERFLGRNDRIINLFDD